MASAATPGPTSRGRRTLPAGNDAHRDLRLLKLRPFRTNAKRTGQRDLVASARRQPIDGRDRRLRDLLQQSRFLAQSGPQAPRPVEAMLRAERWAARSPL